MKKENKRQDDELRQEYDLATMGEPVRGKYAQRYEEGTNVVTLAADVAEAFPDEESVNEALRLLIKVAKSSRKAG